MNSRSELMQKLKAELPYLKNKYAVFSLGIFGSVSRGQHTPSSDIDILVEFSKTPTLFTLIQIENYLSQKLQTRIDLVIKNGVKPEFERLISKDIISV